MAKTRVRVYLKDGVRTDTSWEREKAFRMLFTDFKRKCSDVGIMHTIKEHERFESTASKDRKKLRDAINRRKQDELEQRIRGGEKIKGSSKILKKIKSKDRAKKRREQREKEYQY